MKRFLVIGFAVVLIFAGVVIPAKGQAQTSDLSSQIQALMAQLKLLQAKVDSQNSQSGSSSGSSASSDSITSVTTSCDTSGFSGLKKGSSSSAVSKLQKILNDNGYLSAKPTGYFGSMTQIALKSFQDENGLGVSGMVDSATLKALGGLSSCVTQSSGSDVSSTSDNSSSNSSASGSASLDSSSATSGGSETELAKKKPSSSVSIVNPSGGETFTVGDKIGLTYKPSKIGDQFVVRISTSDVKGGYEYTLGNVKSYSTAYANKEAFKIPTNVIPASYTLSMTQTGLCEKTYSCAIARTQSFTVISSKIITSTSTTPTITSIYPTTAKIGDTVTVYGTNFTEGASVVFLKTSVGAWAKVLSSSQLTFVVPPGVGSDVIQVLLGGGVGSNVVSISILIESNSATPYITDIRPSQGTINNTIAIYGNNIYGVVKSIEFVSGNGNILATLSGSDISAASPAGFLITKSLMDLLGYSGTFWIDVVTSNGTSNKVAFTLTYPNTKSMPSISSISPTSGTSGTSVTIYGTNLSGTSNVEFYNSNNSLAATIFPSSVSANSVVFTVASIFAANVEPGTYQLGVVTNACQGGCNSNRFNFTLNALQSDAPKITSVNPVRGDIDTAVTINGTNLAYVYAVEFYSGGVLKTTITSNNISFSKNSTTDSVRFTMADNVILKLANEVLKLQGSGSSQYYDIRVIAKGTGYSNSYGFTLIPTPIISVTPTITSISPLSATQVGTSAGQTIGVFKLTNNGSSLYVLNEPFTISNSGSTQSEMKFNLFASADGGSQSDTMYSYGSNTPCDKGICFLDISNVSKMARDIAIGGFRYLTVKTANTGNNGDTFQLSINSASLATVTMRGDSVATSTYRVVSPNGGEQFTQGQSTIITYKYKSGAKPSVVLVKGGVNVGTIFSTLQTGSDDGSIGSGTIWWDAGATTNNSTPVAGCDYKIALQLPYGTNLDQSDGTFCLNSETSPKITSVNPVRGDINTTVTINGTNLAYVYAVEFYSGGVLKTTITSNNISFSTNSTTDSVQFTMADDVILKLTDEVLKLQGSGSSQYYNIRVIAKGTGYSNLSSFTLIPTPIISVTPTVTLTSPQSGSYMPMRSITAKWNQNVNGSIKIYLTTDSGYQQEQQSTQGTAGSNSAIFSPNVDPGVYKLNVCLSTDNWQSQACEYSTGNIIIQPAIIKPDNSQIQASIIEQLNYMMDVLKKMQTSR